MQTRIFIGLHNHANPNFYRVTQTRNLLMGVNTRLPYPYRVAQMVKSETTEVSKYRLKFFRNLKPEILEAATLVMKIQVSHLSGIFKRVSNP